MKAAEKKKDLQGPQRRGVSSWSLAPTPSSATRWNFKTWAWSSPTSSTGLGVGQRSALAQKGASPPPAGDERHPHPPHPGLDGLRRPGHFRAGRAAPGRQKIETYLIDPAKTGQGFRLCPTPPGRRPAGVPDLPPDRGGRERHDERHPVWGAGEKRAFPTATVGLLPREDETCRKGTGDGGLLPGENPAAGVHHRGGSGGWTCPTP